MTAKKATTKTADKTAATPAPETRIDDTNENVTELAKVDGDTTLADMKDMSGATDKDASQQQLDALDGLKQAKDALTDPESAPEPNPFAAGPGSDIA